jgi:hypothetical protein
MRPDLRKLSDDDYRAIYLSRESAPVLAQRYDVGVTTITRIWARESKAALVATADLPRRQRRAHPRLSLWSRRRAVNHYGETP